MVDLKQMSRFSEAEMDLLKENFSGEGEQVLYEIRDVLLQFSDKAPKLTEDVLKVVKKAVLKGLVDDVPFGNQADVYFELNEIVKTYPPEIANLHIESRDIAKQYLEQRFRVLEGKGILTSDIQLSDLKHSSTVNERIINMLAYLYITNAYVDSCLVGLQMMSKKVEMTEEQLKEKAEKDSAK